MVGEDIQQGNSESRESKDIKYNYEEKVPVEIREIIRINPKDFSALKHSFEEWVKQWD